MIQLRYRMGAALCTAAMLTAMLAGCGQPAADVEIDTPPVTVEIEEGAQPLAPVNPTIDGVLQPEASGTVTYGNQYATIDASNAAQGYVMVQYTEGETRRIKVQISRTGGTTYTYNLDADGTYDVFPLSQGNGSYQINVFRNVSGTSYTQVYAQKIEVKLADELLPFLYPNQYVDFDEDSMAVDYAAQLCAESATELDKVEAIYKYVVGTIKYDYELARTVQSTYLPDLDNVLTVKKGICFDYASLMSAMLRSQSIPTKLLVGYTSRGEYHAWISVHISEVGWIDNIISFDGANWKLMDPTFASTGRSSKDVMDFINNPANYSEKYCY